MIFCKYDFAVVCWSPAICNPHRTHDPMIYMLQNKADVAPPGPTENSQTYSFILNCAEQTLPVGLQSMQHGPTARAHRRHRPREQRRVSTRRPPRRVRLLAKKTDELQLVVSHSVQTCNCHCCCCCTSWTYLSCTLFIILPARSYLYLHCYL